MRIADELTYILLDKVMNKNFVFFSECWTWIDKSMSFEDDFYLVIDDGNLVIYSICL